MAGRDRSPTPPAETGSPRTEMCGGSFFGDSAVGILGNMHAIVEEQPRETVRSLLIANLIAIILAVYEGWNLREVMLVYWCQSVIIGYYSFRRMLDLKDFSVEGVRMNGRRVEATESTKRSMAGFFVIHYGFFHVAYLFYLFDGDAALFDGGLIWLMVCIVSFLFNHRYSYHSWREQDADRKPNIGTIMLFPYARIVPMHLAITVGQSFAPTTVAGLLFFLVLKTGADVLMHKIEHYGWRTLPGSR